MPYVKKTWAKRVRQYMNRFTLTPTGNLNEYDLTRVEGTVSVVGTPMSTTNMNDHETAIYDAVAAAEAAQAYVIDIENEIETLVNPKLGRYQSEFGLTGATPSNITITADSATLTANSASTVATQDASSNSYDLYTGYNTWGQRFDATFTATYNWLDYADLWIETITGTPGSLVCTVWDETSAVLLATKTIAVGSLTAGAYNRFTFATEGIAFTAGHIIQIRWDATGDSSNKYVIKRQNTDVQANAFNITSDNSWATKSDNTTNDLKQVTSWKTVYVAGTVTKTITPSDVDTWGNLRVTCAGDDANNSVTVAIKDTSDNVLIVAVTLANGVNTIDLSGIVASSYASHKTVFTFARTLPSNTSPTVSVPSWTWEGASNTCWVKLAETTIGSDAAQVDFSNIQSGYKSFRLEFQGRASSSTKRNIGIRFNADDAANYTKQHISGSSTTVAGVQATGQTLISLTDALPVNSTGDYSEGEILIFNSSTLNKGVDFKYTTFVSAAPIKYVGGGQYRIITEINKITLIPDSDSIGTNSRFVLWGCK